MHSPDDDLPLDDSQPGDAPATDDNSEREPLVYVAGELVPKSKAVVSVFDHGLLYGDGVFEGIRIYNRSVFLLEEHVARLYESAKAIRLEIPISPGEMLAACQEVTSANDLVDGYIRLIITRGAGALGLDIRKTSDPQVIIIADTISLYPPELYEEGLQLVTASTIRNHPQALSPRIKSLNYLNNILAKIEATDAGTIEALMLNHQGLVAECTGDNIFVVKDEIVTTPPTDAGILQGVTRDLVIDLLVDAEIDVEEANLTRHDLFVADEVFLTGTAAEVIPVVGLDGRTIGDGTPGPIFKETLRRFREFIASETE